MKHIKFLNERDKERCKNIRSDTLISQLATDFIFDVSLENIIPCNPCWNYLEKMWMQALMSYVLYEFPKQGRTPNLCGVMELMHKGIARDDGTPSELDLLMQGLPEDHPAFISYKMIMDGNSRTIQYGLISLVFRMNTLFKLGILSDFKAGSIKEEDR